MLWTAEAVEDLKKLALEGKSASHISAALGVGSRNAVIGKASRIGIKLSGGGPGSARGKTPSPRRSIPMGDGFFHTAHRRQLWLRRGPRSQPSRRSRVSARGAGGQTSGVDDRRSRDRGDATGEVRGNARIRLPLAARRSEKRGIRLLRAHAGRRASPIAPAIAGWPTGRAQPRPIARERHKARRAGGSPEVHRRLSLSVLEHEDQAWRIRARFAPRRSGLDEQRLQADLARRRLDIGPAVSKAHRRLKPEPIALASFDRKREQAVRASAPSRRRRREARGRRHKRARPRRR